MTSENTKGLPRKPLKSDREMEGFPQASESAGICTPAQQAMDVRKHRNSLSILQIIIFPSDWTVVSIILTIHWTGIHNVWVYSLLP